MSSPPQISRTSYVTDHCMLEAYIRIPLFLTTALQNAVITKMTFRNSRSCFTAAVGEDRSRDHGILLFHPQRLRPRITMD